MCACVCVRMCVVCMGEHVCMHTYIYRIDATVELSGIGILYAVRYFSYNIAV